MMANEAQSAVAIESAESPDSASGPSEIRPWFAEHSYRRDGGGYRPSFWIKLANRLLARLRLSLVPRRLTLRAVAQTVSDPATEYHHQLYCRPWSAGRDVMDYLVGRGLRPEHRVLDFGCGALRAGVWLISYLEVGHYFGVDAHRTSLEVGARYEIPLHGLESKRPRLLHSTAARVEYFGEQFDFILLLAVLIHLTLEARHLVLTRLASVLAPGGRIVVWRFPAELTEEQLREEFGLRIVHRETTRSRFADFELDWVELERAGGEGSGS